MTATPTTGATYEAFAIRYGGIERRAVDTFLHWGEPDRPIGLDFFFWVIRGADRCIVVDTGFSEAASRRRNRRFDPHPREALQRLGIAPEAVTDVILTHLHYDHAGNTGLFPQARFHLQAAEMAFATGPLMRHVMFREHYEAQDIADVVGLNHAGRLVLHEGDVTLAPGISLHLAPGHTPGIQAVRVDTAAGGIVIASDAFHYYANLEKRNPFPIVVDVAQELASYEKLSALAGCPSRLVAGHDPDVLGRFARLSADDGAIVCLHAPLRR